MLQKLVFVLLDIFIFLSLPSPVFSKSSSSYFESFAAICDLNWPIIEDLASGLDLHGILPLCLDPGNGMECIGVKCNSSTSNCELLKKSQLAPIHCIANPLPMEEKVFLKSELVNQQPELALIDLGNGKIVSASLEDIPPISISPKTSTMLQVQLGMDILTCSESSTECYHWSKAMVLINNNKLHSLSPYGFELYRLDELGGPWIGGNNDPMQITIQEDTEQWKTFPALNFVHAAGSMSVVGDMLIVIGGFSYALNRDIGTVEIFNKTSQQWTVKSPLTPVRRRHGAVVINDTALMVIGGYSDGMGYLGSVKILDTNEMTWNELNGLPAPAYDMACGLVNLTYVLCIGGQQAAHATNTAYGLDMALSNPEWERKSSFDLESPALGGYIYQLRDYLYCVTFRTPSVNPATALRRMKSNQATLTWETLDVFPTTAVALAYPYILKGFEI